MSNTNEVQSEIKNSKWDLKLNRGIEGEFGYALEVNKLDDGIRSDDYKLNMIFDHDGIDIYVTSTDVTPFDIAGGSATGNGQLKGGFFVSWEDLCIDKIDFKELRYSVLGDESKLMIGFQSEAYSEFQQLPDLISIEDRNGVVSVSNVYPGEDTRRIMNISKVDYRDAPSPKKSMSM